MLAGKSQIQSYAAKNLTVPYVSITKYALTVG